MAGIYLLVGVGGQVAPFGLFLLFVSLLLYALPAIPNMDLGRASEYSGVHGVGEGGRP